MPVPIDAAVLDADLFQMAPPAIERPFFDPGEDAEKVSQHLRRANRRAAADLEAWVKRSEARLKMLGEALEAQPVTQEHLSRLLMVAETIEHNAETFAIEHSRREKNIRKVLKRMRQISPRATRLVEVEVAEALALARQELEARLEAALVFRALRGRHAPDNDTGIVITRPEDVDRLLAEVMAL